MILEQGIGRIVRIGQEKNEVAVHNILVDGSVDERVLAVLSRKLVRSTKSVFVQQPIIEARSDGTERPRLGLLLDEQVLVIEERNSTELLAALEQSSRIQLTDYAILGQIDSSYCDPDKLRSASGGGDALPWLNRGAAKDWLAEVATSSSRLSEIVEEYN